MNTSDKRQDTLREFERRVSRFTVNYQKSELEISEQTISCIRISGIRRFRLM
jgi:hypothetical protein